MPWKQLREGAVDAGHGLVRERVRDLEDRRARTDVIVVAEGAVEVGGRVAGGGEVRPRKRAGPVDPPHAGATRAAWVEVAPDHSVTRLERLAGRIARDAVSERVNPAGHLVPEDLGIRPPELRDVELATPLVEVGAADVRQGRLDDDRARLRVGHRVLADDHRLAGAVERRDPAGEYCHVMLPGMLVNVM